MVEEPMRDHETLIGTARAAIREAAEDLDPVTEGLITDRLTIHEKHAWMLRATLGGK